MRTTAIALLLFALALPPAYGADSGIDRSTMDTSVRPQDDFYAYVNGTWLKSFEIPADKSAYNAFTRVYDKAEQDLRVIIEGAGASTGAVKGSDLQKVGDMYRSFMDSARVEQLGVTPVRKELDAIGASKDKKALARVAGGLVPAGVNGPFLFFVEQDEKNSLQYIVAFYQSGLTLPDRDYYLKDVPRFTEIRGKLRTHAEKMFALAGYGNPAARAEHVIAIENDLAKAQWSQVESRDRIKTYNKMSAAAFRALAPSFDMTAFSAAAGLSADSVRIYQPSYYRELDGIWKKHPLEAWKSYYQWRLLKDAAPYLSSPFAAENFDFSGRTLRGAQENRPRWKRGVSAVETALGEPLGRMYVEKHFSPAAKERMVRLVENLKVAFRERIDGLEWMSTATKAKAQEKLSRFTAKIGYPDRWRDYSALEIRPDDLTGNLRRSREMEHRRELAKLGKPIDRSEWFMTPQTVNAYYNPSMNEIVFPAAILQPPFFSMEADDAVNYGGIGAVIGHEITHGFDDEGRRSDGDGNLVEWWTPKDGEEFERRAKVMVEQYNGFSPIDTMKVNGELTLGENIADLGGLTVAYHAYLRSLAGKPAPEVDGFKGEQRVFFGWAQVWCGKYRDDALRMQLVSDPHSPGRYRVNGVVANMPEFYRAFSVGTGDKLFRPDAERVRIW
jgi:predicted metalloendopeptidase